MVETISPVVHGGRTSRYWINLGLHALGAVLAAALLGGLLGALGALAGAPWRFVGAGFVVAVALLYAARDLMALPIPLPDLKRQVPEWWRTFFPLPVTSFLYGLGLGVAFFTSLAVGTFVVVAVAALALGDPLVGAAICAPFGLGRAVVVGAANLEHLDGGRRQRLLGRANGLVSLLLAIAIALLAFA